MHNMRKRDVEGITIDFRSHPIAFLLMLCDDLHEWDREPEWSKEDKSITNVYGLNVFRQLDDPRQLFEDEARYNDGTTDETFFSFLCRYLLSEEESEELQKKCKDEFMKLLDSSVEDSEKRSETIRKRIEEKTKKLENRKNEERYIVKVALMQLTNDVITFIYIGGDKDKMGEKEDRITKLWEKFKDLFVDNLSHGPAICILHGYSENLKEEDKRNIFFTAEYDSALKIYDVDEERDPKKKKKIKKIKKARRR